ncbi:hypothetical protein [Streptomyces sp. NBC_00102]|uniref:hypothetical protein n=1 Tax=Streptomyces sp. NBC_00102 TaxID=2975652 RepID=UPI002251EAC6|nr:hypothetical protein [Streptomyces sp. NBC_00102]MCX5401304.1 hypothetical protein [Streptomyces sp. NBC_00102]
MLMATDEAGWVVKTTKPAIGRMVANLQRGNAHLVLERVEEGMEGSWYVQVRLRDDNTYQLEFQDGTVGSPTRTRSVRSNGVCGVCSGRYGGRAEKGSEAI